MQDVQKASMPEFLWGAATSSHQIEGDNFHNDWWQFEAQGKIDGGARSGKATDHKRLWQVDLDHAQKLGLNSYRFSIEWSRIEPEYGQWNQEALDWYKALLQGCLERHLTPMVTLHHFTSPQWFTERGGFTWSHSPQAFAKYVEKVTESLGSLVSLWCTFNEPMVLTAGGYIGGFMPPGLSSLKLVPIVCENLLRAHVLAYDHLKKTQTHAQVGIAHNMIDFMPDHRWHPMERLLCYWINRFYNCAWLDAINGKKQNFSVPGLISASRKVPEAHGRKTADFIGVNYYTKAYVCWRPKNQHDEIKSKLPIGMAFARINEDQSDMGWALHPKGLSRILRAVAEYGLPIYITENGIADRSDRMRGSFIYRHIRKIAEEIQQGLDIRGYYYWSLLDNFEWIKGFGPRFGLLAVDYESYSREARPSAALYRQMILEHEGHRRPDVNLLERFSPD